MTDLMEPHISANLGIYFDAVDQVADDLQYASSDRITDYYWNYGYREDGRALTQDEAAALAEAARLRDRVPAIWQRADDPIPSGWAQATAETWMEAASSDVLRPDAVPADATITMHEHPTDEMVAVFADAYGSGGAEDDVGYFSLPREYEEAYRAAAPRKPVSAVHVAAFVSGRCVAVATICIVGDTVGLYSVGTAHEFRRRGLGRYVSAVACQEGARRGCHRFFLQTEADSPVETMYASLGFRRSFIGSLLTQVT